jgi:hypothetical protein
MWTIGIATSSRMPTVSSFPSTKASTRMSLPYFAAVSIAGIAWLSSFTMVTPTLDPSRGGFTTKGTGIAGKRTPPETSTISEAGVGTPAARNFSFARFLSKAVRLLATPAPV